MKTLIAVPCMDMVATPFAHSLAMLKKVGDCAITFVAGSLIYDSRNSIVKSALEMKADRILWLDSDMMFNNDLLQLLSNAMEEKDADIVTGLYYRRSAPYTPVLFSKLDPSEDRTHVINEGFDDVPDEIFEVAGCGFGCVLMKTDFLVEMGIEYGTWFTPMLNSGEDVAFCIRARELGHKIYCEPKAHCGHVGTIIVTQRFYETVRGGKDES